MNYDLARGADRHRQCHVRRSKSRGADAGSERSPDGGHESRHISFLRLVTGCGETCGAGFARGSRIKTYP